jgi:hypothetical protein
LLRERSITVRSDLAPAKAQGDAALIHQVITNLLANAIHCNKERGEIRVTTRAQDGGVTLAVSDTGMASLRRICCMCLSAFIARINPVLGPMAAAALASPSARPSRMPTTVASKSRVNWTREQRSLCG